MRWAMNENVLKWINKITNAYAECSCGEMCHIHVTIRERDILFRAACPRCRKVFSLIEHILLVEHANMDVTDYCLDKVREALKQPQAEVKDG